MITSMTGFGSAEQVTDQYSLKIEIKTLNSKFFDPIIKIQKELSSWELEIRSILEQGLKRGKVNCTLEYQNNSSGEVPVEVNEELFDFFVDKLGALADRSGSQKDDVFKLALSMPGVVETSDEQKELPFELPDLKRVLTDAINKCVDFRQTEGDKLHTALQDSSSKIAKGLDEIDRRDPERIENIRKRLTQSIDEIRDRVQVDDNRFEQELIFYIDKLDITEEKVRLKSHLNYLEDIMNKDEASGKKLGFLAQEIGREINTIGSKANHAEIQRLVVGMKEELEKIKEQVLNVL